MHVCCRPGCDNPPIGKGNARCSQCHSEYLRNWRKLAKERSARQAYNAGVEDMRAAIVAAFNQAGSLEINGYSAAVMAREVKPG